MPRGGKKSRDKGARGERELVNLLIGEGFTDALRVPNSGAMRGFPDDVQVTLSKHDTPERIEVKRRAQGFKRIHAWLQNCFAVAYRKDGEGWVITLRLSDFLTLIRYKD
ncbi:MAG: hypothetical protein GY721_11220 [Deltaproteobacteria bacterium]|nr:hypothetical protein [Deltaproteobacteria bacterium]